MKLEFRELSEIQAERVPGRIAVPVWEGEPLSGTAAALDARTGGAVAKLAADRDFRAEAGRVAALRHPAGIAAARLAVFGCGSRTAAKPADALVAGAAVARHFGKPGGTLFAGWGQDGMPPDWPLQLALGAGLRRYRFDRYRTLPDPETGAEEEEGPLVVAMRDPERARGGRTGLEARLAGVALARDLVNEPANRLGTEEFAERMRALEADGLDVEVLEETGLEKIGMRALLAVGQGSARPSRAVILRWDGAGKGGGPPLALVGKGVVFDAGGISLKPAKGMEDMVMDMGGAAVVAGAMRTLALRRAKANIVGLIGLVENMPGGRAQRPGDIVASLSGKTIQVINTDAEGRLELADLLWYAQDRFKPDRIVDLATLTGAIMTSLGREKAGLFSNDDRWADAVLDAAREEGEGLWRMPLGKNYAKALRSPVADLRNVGRDPMGGAITAAEFLHAFVRNDVPWAHLDIAGVTLSSANLPLSGKGATGWGVRTLDRLVANCREGGESAAPA